MITKQYLMRIATLADTEMLAALAAKTFYDTFAKYNTADDMTLYMKTRFSTDQIRSEVQDRACTFVLAFDAARPTGYAKLRRGKVPEELQTSDAIEIERLYVSQDYVGKKVGKALMQMCLDLANQKKCSAIWLGVWEHNPKAIEFYQRWGFEKFGTHNFLLGKDLQTDLLMKLSLHN